MSLAASRRFVLGVEGPSLSEKERRLFTQAPPFGIVLFAQNLAGPEEAAALIREIRWLGAPPPLLFVDQEGGTVDRLGPLLGARFPSAASLAERGTDAVHENAYRMGRIARLLGFDVDFAPVVDLAQPGTGAVVLAGRCFGFHAEDVTLAAMVFLHGLARAGLASCLKHFPGLGRAAADTHLSLPVVDAHDVDLMVTDVAPFTRLAKLSDGVMVGHAAYPGFTGASVPASLSPKIHGLLRKNVGFSGVVYSDDLSMGALEGPMADRAVQAANAGCDLVLLSKPFEAFEEAIARVSELPLDPARDARLDALTSRCLDAPRPEFEITAWDTLRAETLRFLETLEKPREKRPELEGGF
jgi:beta-N-acetylhexosaminidase